MNEQAKNLEENNETDYQTPEIIDLGSVYAITRSDGGLGGDTQGGESLPLP